MTFLTSKNLPSLAGLVACLALPLAAQTSDQDHLAKNVFAQLRWRELGPVSSGGRIVDLAVHPQKPQVFWAASASGGLWKTTNGGMTFVPQFQDQYSISIGDIAVAPSNGDVLYVGTGEGNNQRSSYWGNGVYKTTDGGTTWTHLGLDGTDHIGRIAVHPQNPDVVYVAAAGALYSSNDARGLYRSKDGGKTWQHVQDLGAEVGCIDVAIDPQHPDTVFTASYQRRRAAWNFLEGGEGSRLWKSSDGGDTWKKLAGGLPNGKLGRIGVDLFDADPKVLYACVENLNPIGTLPTAAVPPPSGEEPKEPKAAEADAETLADPVARAAFLQGVDEAQDPQERQPRGRTIGNEVFRSEDGGETWKKQNGTTDVGGAPAYYYGQIHVDPQDRETVYVLGVPVYKSTDGGKTWTPRRGERAAFANTLHSDHHALWIDPKDGKHCLLGNDGGLSITWDAGKTWDHLAHLPITQFYTVAVDSRSPYRVYGGLQDNGTFGFPIHGATSSGIQPTDAYRIDGGDGFWVCCDPDEPDVVYSESQFGGMSRQNLRTGERKSIKPRAQKGEQPLRFNWSTPIVLSPHAGHTVYVGTQYLHRSRDRGETWTTISPDLTTNDAEKKKGNVPHCTITTISESPKQEGWLWVGTDDGRVSMSKDGGHRWQDVTERFPTETRGLWVSRVEASPHAAGTAFVAFTGYREDRRSPFLFRTDDGGETWMAIEHDLPLEPINVIRQHPRNSNVLLVGTDMGAYVSVDDGAQWFRLGQGLPRVAVHDLVVHPRESHVLIGTHGRGIWAMDAAALEQLKPEQLEKPFHALPPSGGVMLRRAFSPGNVGVRAWSAANPFTVPTFRYVLAQDSEQKVTVEVKDAAGRVLFTQDGPTKAGYHEVAWAQGGGRGRGQGGQGGGQGQGGQGQGGQGQGGGFPFGRQGGGVRPGMFAVTITRGEESSTMAFTVVDRRGPASLISGVPGIGAETGLEEQEHVDLGEEAEEEGEGAGAGEEPAEATPQPILGAGNTARR